ncbi:TIGR02391 family protein [Nocardia sp. NPDC059240]|uniref:TIGR02391 family protein n=1 Tax=Nocardia sp. NPDC059240 TaxID=3346786 RepID=UPI00369762B3
MAGVNLEGIDVDWVQQQLEDFVAKTKPVNQSGDGVITTQTAPQCGREATIAMAETVRPILTRLYPEWQSENSRSSNDEFKAERDAARRLLARLANHVEVIARLGGADTSPRITASALHPLIWKAASAQWSTGHRHEAVLAASKAVNSLLQAKVGRRDVSESDLVKQAFTDQDPKPGKPRLRYPGISNEQTAESMRRGVMEFGGGCFAAIRNPVGHLPNDELELDEQVALERLCALSLFARWIDEAELVEAELPGGGGE